jgi:hypothetical protein
MLGQQKVIEQAQIMLGWRKAEEARLARIHEYLRGKQRFSWLPATAPQEARRLAKIARVNVLDLVVDSVAQSMYVDGYRVPKSADEAPAWRIWQRNRLDARQIGVHRASLSYGAAYVSVLPGDPVPVMRGISPRNMTAVYGEDDDWPMWALEKRRTAVKGKSLFRLFDDEATYFVEADTSGNVEYISSELHELGKVPVVRFLNKSDLDDEVISEVENLMDIQDQIDMTTFGILVVQHYGAFPQKWIAGWTPATEEEEHKVGVNRVLAFDDPETKLGAFPAADLKGYIDSREASLRHLAAISQTPAHALRGELVNLSAEALAAAEATERRKIAERERLAGEAWEQALELAAEIDGREVAFDAQVRWADTESRALAATVDALGKMAQLLQIPPQELWERVPGTTQQDVERWKAAAQSSQDVFSLMTRQLERQATINAGF